MKLWYLWRLERFWHWRLRRSVASQGRAWGRIADIGSRINHQVTRARPPGTLAPGRELSPWRPSAGARSVERWHTGL
jgi:hypothetical protein